MPPAQPILVPLDGSKNAEHALPAALQFARLRGAPLAVVHVLQEGTEASPAASAAFSSYVEELLTAAGEGGYPHAAHALAGNAAQAILAQAADAGGIAIASQGRGGLKASLVGSVADKVVRGATVPVLVVKVDGPSKPGSGPVVVGLDGSPLAEAGLVAAREFAAGSSAQVVLVRAYSVPTPIGMEFTGTVDLIPTLQEAAEEYLASVAKPGERTVALMASPADAIEATADEVGAGLVVVASHGKGFISRLALGSTTDRLLHAVRRPLLVVPTSGSD